jgi:flagellar protein FlaG
MSFDINSVQGLNARMAPVRSTNRTTGAQASAGAGSTDAVKVEVGGAIPSSPPPEVLDAMGVAAQAHDRLAAVDRGLSFKIDERTGKVVVSVHNSQGQVLFTVPGSKALDIASGSSLNE